MSVETGSEKWVGGKLGEIPSFGQRMSEGTREDAAMRNESNGRPREQLLLEIPRTPAASSPRRVRPCSQARAAWWFQQMHAVVEKGIEVNAPGVR